MAEAGLFQGNSNVSLAYEIQSIQEAVSYTHTHRDSVITPKITFYASEKNYDFYWKGDKLCMQLYNPVTEEREVEGSSLMALLVSDVVVEATCSVIYLNMVHRFSHLHS